MPKRPPPKVTIDDFDLEWLLNFADDAIQNRGDVIEFVDPDDLNRFRAETNDMIDRFTRIGRLIGYESNHLAE